MSGDEAVRELERAVAKAPDSASAHAQLAQALVRAGRLLEAGPHADRAAELDPAFEPLQLAHGEWRSFRRNAARTASLTAAPSLRGIPELAWEREVPAEKASGEVLVVGGKVLAPATGGVWALDLATGEVAWKASLAGDPSVFLSAARSSRVLVQGPEGELWILDAATGASVFHRDAQPEGGLSGAGVARGLAVFGSADRAIALDLATGRERWTARTPAGGSALPAAAGDVVVVGGLTAHALALESGAVRWSAPGPGLRNEDTSDGRPVPDRYRSFAIAEGVVAAASTSLGLLDLARGTARRGGTGGRNEEPLPFGATAFAERTLIVADVAFMAALSLDPSRATREDPAPNLWEDAPGDLDIDYYEIEHVRGDAISFHVGPVVVGRTALFCVESTLRAIDIPTGRDVFRRELPARIVEAPSAAPGWLFIRTADDRVRAYRTA